MIISCYTQSKLPLVACVNQMARKSDVRRYVKV
jgi:hypothetical protein